MADDVFFWNTETHIKMVSRKRDVCIERNVARRAVVFSWVWVGVDSQRGAPAPSKSQKPTVRPGMSMHNA